MKTWVPIAVFLASVLVVIVYPCMITAILSGILFVLAISLEIWRRKKA